MGDIFQLLTDPDGYVVTIRDGEIFIELADAR